MLIAATLLSSFEDLRRGSFRLRSIIKLYKILRTEERETDWQKFFADPGPKGLRKIGVSMLSLILDAFVQKAGRRFIAWRAAA